MPFTSLNYSVILCWNSISTSYKIPYRRSFIFFLWSHFPYPTIPVRLLLPNIPLLWWNSMPFLLMARIPAFLSWQKYLMKIGLGSPLVHSFSFSFSLFICFCFLFLFRFFRPKISDSFHWSVFLAFILLAQTCISKVTVFRNTLKLLELSGLLHEKRDSVFYPLMRSLNVWGVRRITHILFSK